MTLINSSKAGNINELSRKLLKLTLKKNIIGFGERKVDFHCFETQFF